NLASYPWVFDIVPAVPIEDGSGATRHYLIPNGTGDWIRTDPRIDARNLTAVNTAHAQRLLPVMRFLKYWNRRIHDKPRLQPYYFETLVLNVFRPARTINTYREAIKYFFEMCKTSIWMACPDPKG